MLALLLRMPHGPSAAIQDPGDPSDVPAVTTWVPDLFASTTGSAEGDGSEISPWDFQTVLDGAGGALAGKKLAVRGGTYHKSGGWSSGAGLAGSNTNGSRDLAGKIQIGPYPGERAIITDRLTFDEGHDFCLRDVDVQNTDVGTIDKMGVNVHADRVGLLRVRSYDHSGNAFGMWAEAEEAWAEECVGYNSGFSGATPGTSYGHGFYSQNVAGHVRRIYGSVMFNNFGYGLHIYGEGPGILDDFDLAGHFNHNNGLKTGYDYQIGGGTPLSGLVARDLWSSRGGDTSARIGYTAQSTDADIQDCLFLGGVLLYNLGAAALTWKNIRILVTPSGARCIAVVDSAAAPDYAAKWDASGNRYIKTDEGFGYFSITRDGVESNYDFAGYQAQVGSETGSTFATSGNFGTITKVRPNSIDPNTATIAIYNPTGADSVDVDLSGAMRTGDSYGIYHDYNWQTAVAEGTYAGGSVAIPMAATTVTPPDLLGGTLRGVTAPNALPTYGTFLLRRSA